MKLKRENRPPRPQSPTRRLLVADLESAEKSLGYTLRWHSGEIPEVEEAELRSALRILAELIEDNR